EVNYGDWSGRTLEELAADPHWRTYNTYRSATRIPGGETALELQARSVSAIESLREQYARGTVAVVSHSDVIKAILAFYLGMPLDLASRLVIDPASVSSLALEPWGPRILGVNRPPVSTPRPPETAERP
ncbi:MAG TPA: histidine phosphatase family protein, partial [Gemmatimonadales bacterium]|nr:histidine phosphatase family protein [Gemmatimonadales bacterium]